MSDKHKQNHWLAGATQVFSELLGIEPDAVLVAQPIPGVDKWGQRPIYEKIE